MDEAYEIRWVGWNNSFENGTQHDKVWGWLEMSDGRLYCFWGARGKTLRFKLHYRLGQLLTLQRNKESRGYNFVDPMDYDRLVQDFITDVESYCMMAILGETVM